MLFIDEHGVYFMLLALFIVLSMLLILKQILFYFLKKEKLRIFTYSKTGDEEIQEDYFDIAKNKDATLVSMSDGLGKNEAGRISSIASVKTIEKMFLDEYSNEKINYFFYKSFNKVNHEIIKRVEKNKGGTSNLSIIIDKENLYYASLGNVMLALFRKNELIKLNESHCINEVAKREYYKGKIERIEALQVLNNKKILYYLGQENFGNSKIEMENIKLEKNDLILIMSKGIYENIRWVNLENILSENKKHLDIALNEIILETEENKHGRINKNGSIVIMKVQKIK
ncbi:putative phosphatase, PP2C-like [Clostridium neonatale]|uniref:PP2C family protein-serine/threonine phosphatase n=1 Tax=Clostridium neonatale TaxID=137838 RepID=UPI00291BF346|nr:protein phosphatase [Clostridium neonatale]CAI3656830.1 putative phosphatase, PP2C-like [Clostridium neonatale]